jgi:SWI/SNF-related matrix-associated actin-dependent regulator of chromatin subfamily A member 5
MTDTSDNEGDDIINDNEVDAEEICVNEGRKAVLDKIRQVEIADSGAQTPSEKRLSYLMAQSEIFSHFLMGDAGDAKAEEKKPGPGRRKSSSSSSSTGASQPRGGRARKSEASEDRELLKQAQSAAATVTRLHVQPRAIIGGTMRAYQLEGLNWLVKLYDNNVNGILADEMGLGKTLQTISLLAYLLEFKKIRGPHLVVVPKATVSNWIKEFNRWCGYNSTSTGSDKLRVVRLLGDKAEREAIVKTHIKTGEFDVIVTSYEGVIKEQSSLKKIRWKYLVVDEAHRLKNENSLLSRITRMLMTEFRLLITGACPYR